MKVIKRDGRIVDYDKSKIEIAIEKANKEVIDEEKANKEDIKTIFENAELIKVQKTNKVGLDIYMDPVR